MVTVYVTIMRYTSHPRSQLDRAVRQRSLHHPPEPRVGTPGSPPAEASCRLAPPPPPRGPSTDSVSHLANQRFRRGEPSAPTGPGSGPAETSGLGGVRARPLWLG